MKILAYYEKFHAGWALVVYHDGPPVKSSQGPDPIRHGPYIVPEDMLDTDGSPNLGKIMKAFPEPPEGD